MLEARSKFFYGLKSLIRIFRQSLQHALFKSGRDVRVVASRRRRHGIDVVGHHLKIAFALKRQVRRKHFIQSRA
jgi:hypothetical protein